MGVGYGLEQDKFIGDQVIDYVSSEKLNIPKKEDETPDKTGREILIVRVK